MARKPYTWSKVKNGDIISFHYETKRGPDKGRKLLRTILVINKLFRKNKIITSFIETTNIISRR